MDSDTSYIDYSFIQLSTTESLLTTSQYAKVIFHNIEERYSIKKDLICQYSLTEVFVPKLGDRIVIFKLGWQQITDYEVFEWAVMPEDNVPLQVIFQAASLPKDSNEFYQICYVSAENTICGASVPFQFSLKDFNLVSSTTSETALLEPHSNLPQNIEQSSTDGLVSESVSQDIPPSTTKEISNGETLLQLFKLKEENQLLKESLYQSNTDLKNYDTQINSLKEDIRTLQEQLKVTQNDVSDLKIRIAMAGDEFKKVYTEKARAERKYEKLVKKCQSKKSVDVSNEYDFLGELEPLPAFPYPL